MSEKSIIADEVIIQSIYQIRGQKVMIDRDLARLFNVETRTLKQAVRRNIARFPEDFMFEMSKEEFENWRSQIVMSKEDKKGLRYAPFCFTEQGVTMLSCVLRSPTAVAMNIQIVRIFVKLRQTLLGHNELLQRIESIERNVSGQGNEIKVLFEYLKKLMAEKEQRIDQEQRNRIGYKKK